MKKKNNKIEKNKMFQTFYFHTILMYENKQFI